jgi:hypothetical protein
MPKGPAWAGDNIGKLLDVINSEHERCRQEIVKSFRDFNPATTEMIPEWERIFSIPGGSFLSDTQRRSRLSGRWSMLSTGTMSPENMERVFSLSGFTVKVRVLAAGEDPRLWFVGGGPSAFNRVGSRFSAENVRFGNSGAVDIPYLLVNESQWKVETIYTGDYGYEMYGDIQIGEIESQDVVPASYSIPDDEALWPMLYVIESPAGGVAEIPLNRINDFIELAYITKPLHMWAIARIRGV